MQLSSPLFLFLFLPVALACLPLCPPKHRRLALTLISLSWLMLSNLSTPLSLLQILAVVLFVCLLAALPAAFPPLLRCLLGIVPPLVFCVGSRLLAEFAPFSYVYPMGLTMVTLGAISVAVDRYRSDAPDREGPVCVAGYLLFFPVLALGPVLRYKQYLYLTEHIAPNPVSLSRGIKRYMLGFIKRIAIAAVLFRVLEDFLSYSLLSSLPLPGLLLLLLLSFALFYYFITGTVDMARGLMAMCGMNPPRDRFSLLYSPQPHRMLYGTHLSLSRYLEDYVARPITRRVRGPLGLILSTVAVFVLTVSFWRPHPIVLLVACPALLIALLALPARHWRRRPRSLALRIPLCLLSLLLLSPVTLAMVLREPGEFISLCSHFLQGADLHAFYYLFGAIPDAQYIAFSVVLLLLSPLAHFYPGLEKKLPRRLGIALQYLTTGLLFACFVVTLLFFLPQFPQGAELSFTELFL